MIILCGVKKYSFIVIGAGVVGLSVARELLLRGKKSVLVLDKESKLGVHSSGRNSGVIHAGIYYPQSSLKAKLSVRGGAQLLEYCARKNIPHQRCGKVVVATREDLVPSLDLIAQRAHDNGVPIEKLSVARLREVEPEAVSSEYALWSPNTAIVDSKAVLAALSQDILEAGGHIQLRHQAIRVEEDRVVTNEGEYQFEFLINAAGLQADKMAHSMGSGLSYKIIPFKGIYWSTKESYKRKINHLIYPTPDLTVPFLGVHVTKTVEGKVLLGPTAIPAFGRENYGVFEGLDLAETPGIVASLSGLLLKNKENFRKYVGAEFRRYFRKQFLFEAQKLTPCLQDAELAEVAKVGIRAQLFDKTKGKLEMDFVVEKTPRSLHILNAVSPAFTSSLAFAEHVVGVL